MPYGYYRTIIIDHTKVPGNLTNHPFLFNTTHNDLRSTGNGGHVVSGAFGYDIIFSPDPAGTTKYDHEIEKYDGATGEFIAHVRIPAISSSVDTVFYIIYGDPDVTTSRENITGVWDANFLMVQHMRDATTSTILDSTSNNNDGTKKDANEPIEAAGPIGQAQDFDGSDDLIDVGMGLDMTTNDFTISTWLNSSATEQYQTILSNTEGAIAYSGYIIMIDDSNQILFQLNDQVVFHNYTNPSDIVADGTDHQIVLVVDRDNDLAHVYVDGTVDAGNIDISAVDGSMSSSRVLWLGRDPNNGLTFVNVLDEIRISDIARGTDYITATFNNQNDPGTFYGLQTDEQIARPPRSGVTFASMIGVV